MLDMKHRFTKPVSVIAILAVAALFGEDALRLVGAILGDLSGALN